MAIVLEGDGTITGVTTFTTPLDDISFDSINVTGIVTASTFQAGTGVSMASPRSQNIALFTNNVEGLTLDDAGRVGIGTTNANKAADANNAKVVNAGIITANQYYGNQLTAVGSRVTGVGTFENGLNITGNITNGLNVSAGIVTFSSSLEVGSGANSATQKAAFLGGYTIFENTAGTGNPSITFNNDIDTGILNPAANTLAFNTGGDERVRINSSGQLLVGTTTEGYGDADDLTIYNSGHAGMTIRSGTSSLGTIAFSDATSGSGEYDGYFQYKHNEQFFVWGTAASERMRLDNAGNLNIVGITTIGGDVSIADKIIHTGDTDTAIRFPSANQISFETSGSEGVRIDGGGRLLVGTTVARTFGGSVYAHLQLEGTTQQGSQFTVTRNTNDTYAPNISLVKTRGTSDGAVTTVQDNDQLGQIQFRGADGSDVYAVASSIHSEVDGSPSDGTDMPGALVFGTTADGAASPTERLRITSAGYVGINEPSPACRLDVEDGASGGDGITEILRLNGSPNSLNDGIKINFARAGSSCGSIVLEKVNNNNTTDLIVSTRASNTVSETVRITGGGKVGIGLTNPESYYSTELVVAAANGGGITIQAANNHVAHLMFADGSTGSDRYAGYLGYNHNTEMLLLRADGAGGKGLNIESDGDVALTHGNLVVANGKGIDFSAQTASSATGTTVGTAGEILDHYEEGAWTATVRGNTGAGTYTATAANGRYTRIGDLCTLTIYTSYQLTGASGYWEIFNIPFTARTGNYATGSVFIKHMNIVDNVKNNVLYIGSSGTVLTMYGTQDDATWVRQEVDNTSAGTDQGIIGTITYKLPT